MIIVSDTSPIANLIQIDKLNLLESIFGKIVIPPEVNKEILELQRFGISTTQYQSCDWIEIKEPTNLIEIQQLLNDLDKGESEAIALAKELNVDFLLIDERHGSKIAKEQGLNTIGLIGVLIKAKELKIILKVKPTLLELRDIAGFWISDKFLKKILKIVNEK